MLQNVEAGKLPKVKEICVSCQLMNSLFRDTGPKSAGTFMLQSKSYREKATDSRVWLGVRAEVI